MSLPTLKEVVLSVEEQTLAIRLIGRIDGLAARLSEVSQMEYLNRRIANADDGDTLMALVRNLEAKALATASNDAAEAYTDAANQLRTILGAPRK